MLDSWLKPEPVLVPLWSDHGDQCWGRLLIACVPSQLQSLEGKIVSGLSLPFPSVVGPHVVGPFRPSPQGSKFLLVPGGKTSSRKLALKFPLRNGAPHRADQISTRMSCRRIKPFGTWRQFRGKDPLNGIPRNKTNHKQ